jgi:hypothetical protein
MYVHKETLTINDPKTLILSQALPLAKGQRVEVVVTAYEEDNGLETLRSLIDECGITESDVADAIAWARSQS